MVWRYSVAIDISIDERCLETFDCGIVEQPLLRVLQRHELPSQLRIPDEAAAGPNVATGGIYFDWRKLGLERTAAHRVSVLGSKFAIQSLLRGQGRKTGDAVPRVPGSWPWGQIFVLDSLSLSKASHNCASVMIVSEPWLMIQAAWH